MASSSDWSRYWASGAVHSCLQAFDGNYDDEVRAFWLAFFGALKEGAQILDIGTGNGAIPMLASEAANLKQVSFRIVGIDAARIDPAHAAARLGIDVSDITFLGNTPGEDTNLPDASFDAVSSHFAVEYMDRRGAIQELARISKPGGQTALVIHHQGSLSAEAGRAELAAFEFIIHEAPLLARSISFLAHLKQANDENTLLDRLADAGTRSRQQEIEVLLGRVVEKAREHEHYAFLDGIAKQTANVLEQTPALGPDNTLGMLLDLAAEANAHRARLGAMIDAAFDRTAIDEFVTQLEAAGFTVQPPGELYRHGKELIGWTVLASRAQ